MRIVIAALWIASALRADQITLKNGDRVSGEVVKKDAANLTFKSALFGVITVAWDQVAAISVDKPLHVETAGGQKVEAAIQTTGDEVRLRTTATEEKTALASITVMRNDAEQKAYQRFLHPGIGDLWGVAGTLGVASASGNARTFSFTMPIAATRVSNTSKTSMYFNLIRASALVNGVNSTTAQAVRGGWAFNRNLHPRVFWNVFNDYEYDRFQSLALRVVAGSGFGYGVWKGEKGRLDVVGGGAWNRESFDPARPRLPFVRNSAEAFWGNDLGYKLSNRATLNQSYRMFNNLTNTGAYRQNFDIALSTKLTSWLTWSAAVSDRYLSNPVPGRKKNDVLLSTGFGFTLSR